MVMMKKSLMATLLAGCATSIRLATTKQFLQSGMKNDDCLTLDAVKPQLGPLKPWRRKQYLLENYDFFGDSACKNAPSRDAPSKYFKRKDVQMDDDSNGAAQPVNCYDANHLPDDEAKAMCESESYVRERCEWVAGHKHQCHPRKCGKGRIRKCISDQNREKCDCVCDPKLGYAGNSCDLPHPYTDYKPNHLLDEPQPDTIQNIGQKCTLRVDDDSDVNGSFAMQTEELEKWLKKCRGRPEEDCEKPLKDPMTSEQIILCVWDPLAARRAARREAVNAKLTGFFKPKVDEEAYLLEKFTKDTPVNVIDSRYPKDWDWVAIGKVKRVRAPFAAFEEVHVGVRLTNGLNGDYTVLPKDVSVKDPCTAAERDDVPDYCAALYAVTNSHLARLVQPWNGATGHQLALYKVGECALNQFTDWLNKRQQLEALAEKFKRQKRPNEFNVSGTIADYRKTLEALKNAGDSPCKDQINALAAEQNALQALDLNILHSEAATRPVQSTMMFAEETNRAVWDLTMAIIYQQMYTGKTPSVETTRLRENTDVLKNLYVDNTGDILSNRQLADFKRSYEGEIAAKRGYMRLSAVKKGREYTEIHGLWENRAGESMLQCDTIKDYDQCQQARQPIGELPGKKRYLCEWHADRCRPISLDTGRWSNDAAFANNGQNNQDKWVNPWKDNDYKDYETHKLWQREAMKHGSVLGFKNENEYDIEGYVNRVADLRKHWRDTWMFGTKGIVTKKLTKKGKVDEKRVDLLFLGSKDTFRNKMRTPKWMWKVEEPQNDHEFKGWN